MADLSVPSASGSPNDSPSSRPKQTHSPDDESAKKPRVENEMAAPDDSNSAAAASSSDAAAVSTTPKEEVRSESEMAGGSASAPAQVHRRRADKPHFATREPEYIKADRVEVTRLERLAPNETIVTANYYPLSFLNGSRFASDLKFHRFDVEFQPPVPRIHRRHVVEEFNKQHFPDLSLGFDGNTLCFALASAVEKTELGKQLTTTKTVTYVQSRGTADPKRSLTTDVQMRRTTISGPVKAEDGTAFLQAINTCVKKALCKAFNLKVFKDVLWDLTNRETINCTDRNNQPQSYELVRGYDITVKPAQTGFYLTIDDTSRIFKRGHVLDEMNATRLRHRDSYKQQIEDRLRNSILYNTIGNELIRVAEVLFDPKYWPINYKFKWRRGSGPDATEKEVSIYEYYETRYNKKVTERQPLIKTVPPYKLKPNATDEEKALWESRTNLIPADLCMFTGLDQAEKSNFHLMKQINEKTKPLAMKKKIDLDEAVRTYLLDDGVKKEMSGMQMKVDVVETSPFGLATGLRARLIQPPAIEIGRDPTGNMKHMVPAIVHGRNGPSISFERDVRTHGAVIPHQEKYVIAIITTTRDENYWKAFYEQIQKAADHMQLGKLFAGAKPFYAESPKTAAFSAAVEECCKFASDRKLTPFMFVLVPDELKERYDQIKQVSLLDYGFMSQVLKVRTIDRPNISVATKVVIQVAAKMGTVNWALYSPAIATMKSLMKSTLIVGLDVHHDGERRGSVQAVVGTLDDRASIFYQRSRLVARGEEISENSAMYSEYIKDMISVRSEKNIKTEVIIIYRDGVSEGQIETALKHEYEPLSKALAEWGGKPNCPYSTENVPKIIFVFVMKRHSTRFFQFNADGDTELKSPGYDGGGSSRGGRGGGAGFGPRKKFENPIPGTVVSRGIVRSDRAEFYLASHDTKEGCICPMRYEILRNETKPPAGMSNVEAAAKGFKNVPQETIEDLTFYLTALYPNQCATIRLPVVCQLAQKFAMLSGQHLHQDAVDLQTNLRKKLFYL